MEGLKPTDPQQVGRYRIAGLLGAGGMGRVYMGRSPSGRLVAVKVVRPELADDPGFRRRFAREVAAARKVTGFFTAALVDADPDGSPPWLATAYVPGMALDQAVAAHGPWPVASVRALGAGLAEALEAIHEAGLIHRDLKPSNVLIAPDGPRVVDFGISVAAEATVLTHAGTAVGTPGFMSPEQLTGDAVTAATDVFALGAVLTYAATGTGPFGTGSAQSLNFRIAYEEPRLEGLPGQGLEVVARCLAKDPAQRPDVSTLIRELADMTGDASYTPTQIVTDTAAWLPDQVAAAVSATVTSAAVPGPAAPAPATPAPAVPAPGAPRGPRKAPASPRKPARPKPAAAAPVPAPSTVSAEPQRRTAPGASPAGSRKTVAEGASPTGPLKATKAGASATPPRKATKAPSTRPALAGEFAAAATPVTPAAVPHLWTVRRVLFLSVACIAFVLALCLPFGNSASVFASLISGWWPWWTSDWPFGGTWPFVVAIGLAVTSCVAVLVQLRRFPTGPIPRPVRRLHYLATTLAGALLALHVTLGLGVRGDLSFLDSGAWFYVLGCMASLAGTVRLKGPKSGGSAA
ncbi:serine/threonine-protein kinase [Streptomyces sp. NPDC048404]|uniref:serine/threonine-protein kinase n=1 Tax=unclassified Streptomyces TaxID=2593676 RepID=UPI0034210E9B